jgi:hypothetical protein
MVAAFWLGAVAGFKARMQGRLHRVTRSPHIASATHPELHLRTVAGPPRAEGQFSVIPACLLNEDECIEIEGVSWADSDLSLRLRLFSDSSRWLVTCVGTSAWRIEDRVADGLCVEQDDPILWRSQFATYSTYFAGKPDNPHLAACDVLSAIPSTAGVLSLAPSALADLLATGSGSLGSLPVPAIRVCQPILKEHGVELYHLGGDESEMTTVSSVLKFGNGSYIIAERFNATLQN